MHRSLLSFIELVLLQIFRHDILSKDLKKHIILSKNPSEFKEDFSGTEELSRGEDFFLVLPKIQQARTWDKLHRLSNDQNNSIRYKAAFAIGSTFLHVPDKKQAWEDLHRLSNDQNIDVKSISVSAIGFTFLQATDKKQAWEDLHRLSNDQNDKVRSNAVSAIGSVFPQVHDKKQAWEDLHRLANDINRDVRSMTATAIGSAFSFILEKQQAWNDLYKLATDEHIIVRYKAVDTLGPVFPEVPNKQQAWSDLYKLAADDDDVSYNAAIAVDSAFSYVPDKKQAWSDLDKMTNDVRLLLRARGASFIGSSFSDIPDKKQAWEDLHRLTYDKSHSVRAMAAFAIGPAFSYVPDKQQAWSDLHRLTNDEKSWVRSSAASAIGSAFSQIPDKEQAWNDLHKLTIDRYDDVRSWVASAIASAFPFLPDKKQAWNDLLRLSIDEINVGVHSNYSLGKISIFKASQAKKEEDYKKELERAIEFFERASQESNLPRSHSPNPSQFCLPFYRSFYTIIFKNSVSPRSYSPNSSQFYLHFYHSFNSMVFKKQEAKDEVNKYLEETKAAVKSSKDVFKNSNTKELFFEVANNLANLLKEVQDQESLGFEAKKDELNFYIKYFDRVEELMIETEKTAPYATIAIRRGLPILDRNLRSLLEEIQEKAKTACNKSIGTPTQEIASTVNMEVQKWEIGSQEEMSWYVNSLVTVLKSKIPHNFENREILGMIESMKYEKDLTKQYRTLSTVMGLIPTVNVIPNQVVKDIKDIKEKIIPVPEDLKELRGSIDQLTASIDKLQNPQECLNIIQRDLKEIKVYIPGMKEQIDKLLDELDTPLSTTQKLKISIPIIPSLVSYEQETDVPKFVADRIDELKSLVLHFKQR